MVAARANFSDVGTYVPFLLALSVNCSTAVLAAILSPKYAVVIYLTGFYIAIFMHYTDRTMYHLTWTCLLCLNLFTITAILQNAWPDRYIGAAANKDGTGATTHVTTFCAQSLFLQLVRVAVAVCASGTAQLSPQKQKISAALTLLVALCQAEDPTISYFGGLACVLTRAVLYTTVFSSVYLVTDIHRIPPPEYGLRVMLASTYILTPPVLLATAVGTGHLVYCQRLFLEHESDQAAGGPTSVLPNQADKKQQSTNSQKLTKQFSAAKQGAGSSAEDKLRMQLMSMHGKNGGNGLLLPQ